MISMNRKKRAAGDDGEYFNDIWKCDKKMFTMMMMMMMIDLWLSRYNNDGYDDDDDHLHVYRSIVRVHVLHST